MDWGRTSISEAVFIPPSFEHISDLMNDLELFINDESTTPNLIKIAIIHYQFETIHPFLEGSGRIGRILIPLYLMYFKEISNNALFISSYIEKNKNLYYEKLDRVRTNFELNEWIKFFLSAVIEICKNSQEIIVKLLKLQTELNEEAAFNGSIFKNIIGICLTTRF